MTGTICRDCGGFRYVKDWPYAEAPTMCCCPLTSEAPLPLPRTDADLLTERCDALSRALGSLSGRVDLADRQLDQIQATANAARLSAACAEGLASFLGDIVRDQAQTIRELREALFILEARTSDGDTRMAVQATRINELEDRLNLLSSISARRNDRLDVPFYGYEKQQ